jgi:hypothetical protein
LATELINRLNSQFGVKLSVQELFSYPTVSALSKLIDSKLNTDVDKPVQTRLNNVDLVAEVNKHDHNVIK